MKQNTRMQSDIIEWCDGVEIIPAGGNYFRRIRRLVKTMCPVSEEQFADYLNYFKTGLTKKKKMDFFRSGLNKGFLYFYGRTILILQLANSLPR